MRRCEGKREKFYNKNPEWRNFLDKFRFFLDWTEIIMYSLAGIYVIVLIALAYLFYLTDDVKASATVIVGGLLSVCVFPLLINFINKRVDIQNERYVRLREFYIKLVEYITKLQENNNRTVRDLLKFIEQSYPTMLVDMPKRFNFALLRVKKECDLMLSSDPNHVSSIEMIKKTSDICIKIIREQGNVAGAFKFDDFNSYFNN